MNRDVASPPPPSGLRSLLAVCVPLMHSHSLACSCKTSRVQVSTSSNISVDSLCVFCLFLSDFFSFCFLSSLHESTSGAPTRHAPRCSVPRKCTDELSHDWISLFSSFSFFCFFSFGLSEPATPFAILTLISISRYIHDQHEMNNQVCSNDTRIGTNDWWWDTM